MKELLNELMNYSGRFNRARYWSYNIGINLIHRIFSEIADYTLPDIANLITQILLLIVGMYFLVCMLIKRSHDLDKSGKFVWLYFIPLVNLYPAILFGFIKGTDGPNQYGSDPTLIP